MICKLIKYLAFSINESFLRVLSIETIPVYMQAEDEFFLAREECANETL